MKRTTLKGRGQSQRPNTPLGPKPPEKKAVVYFTVTHTERDNVAHGGGTLIMLSEEDGRMLSLSLCGDSEALSRRELICHRSAKILCPLFFLTDPWEKENGRARGAESLSEKKADREHREARLKLSQCEQSAPLSAASAWDFPKCDRYSACHQRAGDSCTSYNDGVAFATTLC